MNRPLALIIDDDEHFLASLDTLVAREGFETATARSLRAADEALRATPPDVVLVDLRLPDGDGWHFLQERGVAETSEVIVVTGNATVETAVDALQEGALDYLVKPVDRARLTSCLENVARTRRLKGEIESLRTDLLELGRFGTMIGRSEAMQRVYDLVQRVAPTDLSVLVLGESGVGKELVAETIHRFGAWRDGPLLPVNCGAIAANLIESELFGHERGAFTGADRTHAGCFESARGGTLFLDEITEMPADMQVRLLRVLESRQVTRVGGSRPVTVDVRVVAATNRDPEAAVADGTLREDLYYRLDVFPIEVPPLRERRGDVALLAQAFLDELNRRHETAKTWSPGALARLERHPFPGNVRELRNLVSRAFIMGDELMTPDLVGEAPASARSGPAGAASFKVTVGSSIKDVERRLIESTLATHDGDKARTAKVLGISLKTLYNRLKLYEARDVAARE